MKHYRVVITDEAAEDLLRLQAFAIDRELARATPIWTSSSECS